MGKAPYKNVLVNDLILDKNGKKMSKSKGNTVSPFELFDKYGADATRWYLLSVSPAWTPTKFDEDGLKDVVSKFFGTLKNVYNFFVLYSNQDGLDVGKLEITYDKRPELDRWILSRYNKLVKEVREHMDNYDHMKTVRALTDFVSEDFSNWYIRRARRRFYGSEMTEDKMSVYATSFEVLVGVSLLIAPFAPFISDEIYTKLTGAETVHTAYLPECNEALIDNKVEERMELVRSFVTLGRGAREKERIKVRQPLGEILVDGKYKPLVADLTDLIMEELNVKNVVFADELGEYMNLSLKPNFKLAGPVLGKNIKQFGAELAKLDAASFVAELDAKGEAQMTVAGETVNVPKDFVDVRISAKDGFAVAMENNIFTILDTVLTPELVKEGLAREVVSKVQQLRKQNDFEMMDRIDIVIDADEDVCEAVKEFADYIKDETLADTVEFAKAEECFDINGHKTGICVVRK